MTRHAIASDSVKLNFIDDNLAWGVKAWRTEQGIPVYLFEVHFYSPNHLDDEWPVYVREKVHGDPQGATTLTVVPTMTERLVRILTDADYREEIREWSYSPEGTRVRDFFKNENPYQ